jgi:hypothetical protein
MAFVLRTTGKDGARGALLTSFLVLGGLATLSWWAATDRNWRGSLVSAATRLQVVGVAAVFSVVAVLFPSTKSGMTSAMGIDGSGGSGSMASGSSQSSSGLPSETGGSGGHAGTTNVTDISIPYFDLQSLGIRLQQYLGGLYIAADHPLFGVGGGNYPFVAGRYGLPEKLGGGWFPLHNVYIAALAETGIPGFLLYATASVMVVWAGWCLYRSGGADRAFHAGLLAAVIGYLAVAFWVVNVRFTMVLPFWLVAAALYAEYAGDMFGTETIA